MDYILEQIYFDPAEREKEFQELKNNPNATHEEITKFLEKENNMDISGEDWKKLVHCSGLLEWSM
jgi:transposase